MNKIRAKIVNVAKSGNVALVKLEMIQAQNLRELSVDSCESSSNRHIFTALMLDFTDNLSFGRKCSVVFKESEVMIASLDSRLSARNCFKSRIDRIECDEIFARIYLDFNGTQITSLITKEASFALNLKVGENALWFVKSNEIMLEFK